jgi:hypothetical protein
MHLRDVITDTAHTRNREPDERHVTRDYFAYAIKRTLLRIRIRLYEQRYS